MSTFLLLSMRKHIGERTSGPVFPGEKNAYGWTNVWRQVLLNLSDKLGFHVHPSYCATRIRV
mgnify:CR=1 FL=1|jgi:hypothetical protein